MNDSHRRRFERLARTSGHFQAGAVDFPEGSRGALALTELRAAIAEAEAHAVSRESSINSLQQATLGRQDEREAIRAYLRAMSDTTHTIGLEHPEFKGTFVFKGASVSDRTLLTTARAFATGSQPHRALFNEYDLGTEFFNRFDAHINRFEQQLSRQAAGRGERIEANASLEAALRRAEAALEKLDTITRNRYREDPAKLTAWESAHRLERPARAARRGRAE